MRCDAKEEYFHALAKLTDANVRYAVIGTFGLLAHGLVVEEYIVSDCDLIVEQEQLKTAWETLRNDGWDTFLWEERIHEFPSVEQLRDKYYVRARRGTLTIDICYENGSIDYAQWINRRKRIGEIFVASTEDILELKRENNREKDRRLLDLLNEPSS